ncbi:hypothetical protein CQW23_09541 [Capsicum baccatum]|uniref:Ubiquitin-like protease family profile domain-containing protein n=1 Tax=Capsicum baccatum TaxID=33114 RepID=A0A2G2WX23_CAPBA|nr:hypothetical protein CQW23_09541 [Capsicum baccatum]
MQSYIVSKKIIVPDFKKVDKRKKFVGQHDSNSDFEDEIFAPKIKKSKIKISENARVTRSKVNVSVGKVDDKMSDKKKSRNVFKCVANRIGSQTPRTLNWESSEELIFYDYLQSTMFKRYSNEYVFSDIVFTDEEELIFNLGAIHQDSLGYEYHSNDSDHFVSPITEDTFSVLKNEIANYIRGYKLLANVPWNSVDNMIIPVNVDHVRSLSTMIPLLLAATNFYGKRSDIGWHRKAAYIDKSLSEPLEYVILKDTPHQGLQSNDCGMFVCAFTEYISHGIFDISSTLFDVVNHRLRYDALL